MYAIDAPPFKTRTTAIAPRITNAFKRTNMAGVSFSDDDLIACQFESDIQRAIQVLARFLALCVHADDNLLCLLLYFV